MRTSLWHACVVLGMAALTSLACSLAIAFLICTSTPTACASSSTRRGTAPRLPMSCCICAADITAVRSTSPQINTSASSPLLGSAQTNGLLTGSGVPYLHRGDLPCIELGPQCLQLMKLPEGHPQGRRHMASRLQVVLVLAAVRRVRHKRLLCLRLRHHWGNTICNISQTRDSTRLHHLHSLGPCRPHNDTGKGAHRSFDKHEQGHTHYRAPDHMRNSIRQLFTLAACSTVRLHTVLSLKR